MKKRKQGAVVIVPVNDAEAAMISKIAEAFEIDQIISRQRHGASLDVGRNYVKEIKKGNWKEVVIVEMPGLKTEKKLKEMGCRVVIIDHHDYTGLKRARDQKTGRRLKSSLEQFLSHVKITPAKLRQKGFDPRLVKGIGIFDRGFVWSLYDEGFTKKEVAKVLELRNELLGTITTQKNLAQKNRAAETAWKNRKKWNGHLVFESKSVFLIRGQLSLLLAKKYDHPKAIILSEQNGKRFYVQETKKAEELFEHFGGFTYGTHRNWGYRNDMEQVKLTLEDVKKKLKEIS